MNKFDRFKNKVADKVESKRKKIADSTIKLVEQLKATFIKFKHIILFWSIFGFGLILILELSITLGSFFQTLGESPHYY